MAQISEIPFNPSNPSSAIRSREQTSAVPEPPARETEEVQNDAEGQGQSTASVERAAQQEERANAARDAETKNDSVRTENRRDQITEDVIESQEQGPNSPSALGGLAEANPTEGNPEDVSASPTEFSRGQSRGASPELIEDAPQEAPGARADEVRNEQANEVSQDRLRDFETRNQEGVGQGSNAEVNETVTRQRDEARVSDEPAFDVPEQRVNEAGTTVREQPPEPVNNQGQSRENEPPQRPTDAPTERGLNIDQLI
jgi:hypothetical protein